MKKRVKEGVGKSGEREGNVKKGDEKKKMEKRMEK